ncbi:MAG: ABC transporter substrate-binding protein [Planctomycetota bacterium]|nr:ABC transporter substrate-binding protein [Planctomycetota bacterium]MDA1179281.1 ABC transporter substrate-binding protein [Planctomycetota bacterium]
MANQVGEGVEIRRREQIPLVFAIIFYFGLHFGQPTLLAQPLPLFKADAYDRLAVKDDTGKTVVHRILPLDAVQRDKWLKGDKRDTTVEVRLLDNPEQRYEVRRSDIVRLEFFEDRLVIEANRLLAQKNFDDVFGFLLRLQRDYPEQTKVPALLRDFLYLESRQLFEAGSYEAAWIRLDEAQTLAPNDDEINALLTKTIHQMMQQAWDTNSYGSVLQWQDRLKSRYGESQVELLQEWQSRIDARVGELAAQLSTQMESKNFVGAYETAYQVAPFRSQDPTLAASLTDLELQFPTIRIGVAYPILAPSLNDDLDWRTRRVARLLGRTLTEATQVGAEGCRYASPLGNLVQGDSFRDLRLEFSDSRHGEDFWSSQSVLDFARQAHPLSSIFGGLGPSTSIPRSGQLLLRTSDTHLILAGFLRIGLSEMLQDAYARSSDQLPLDGAYGLPTLRPGVASFVANPDYLFRSNRQYQQVVESTLKSSRDGLELLRDGRIDVIDRLYPAEIPKLEASNDLQLVPYAVPSVHVLAINPNRPWMANRTFRRALTYLLDRQDILQRTLLAGQEIDGCRVISGPIPAGKNPEDPIAYGYDESIAPYETNLGTGLVLIEAALGEIKRSQNIDVSLAQIELRLAYPVGEIAAEACAEICRQWSAVGVRCVPVPWENEEATQTDDWDLLYRDLVMVEPLIDVAYFSANSSTLPSSAYLTLAINRVQESADWQSARTRLRELHRVFHEDVSVISLWQLQDYAVHRRGFTGIVPPVMRLYDSIEDWRSDRSVIAAPQPAGVLTP